MAKTFEQIRDEAMEFARKNGLDEVEAQKHLRRKLRNAGVALPLTWLLKQSSSSR